MKEMPPDTNTKNGSPVEVGHTEEREELENERASYRLLSLHMRQL